MPVHSICKTEITLSFPIFHLMPKIWHGTEVLLLLCNNNVIHKKFKRSSSPIMQMLRNSFLIIIWCQIIIKWRRNSLSLSNCWGRYSKSRGKKSNWQFRAWKTLAPNLKFHLQSREVTAFSPSRNWRLYNLRFLCKLKKKKKSSWKRQDDSMWLLFLHWVNATVHHWLKGGRSRGKNPTTSTLLAAPSACIL